MICQKALSTLSMALAMSRRRPARSCLHRALTSVWRTRCARSIASTVAPTLHRLTSRGLLEVRGRETVDFLQGLVTSDITQLGDNIRGQYSMMLNVKGRVLYDLLLYSLPDRNTSDPCILLECDASVVEEMTKILRRYKIRKKVEIRAVSKEWNLLAAVGAGPKIPLHGETVVIPDPRVPAFGWRMLHPSHLPDLTLAGMAEKTEDEYHTLRYRWGIPEGVLDLPTGNCLPLEANLIFHNGVSFQKGCYLGQELTARTHHTGVTRKRLMPLEFLTNVENSIEGGANIARDDGKSVGKYRHSVGRYGLGLMRVTDVNGPLTVTNQNGEAIAVKTYRPSWWPDTD